MRREAQSTLTLTNNLILELIAAQDQHLFASLPTLVSCLTLFTSSLDAQIDILFRLKSSACVLARGCDFLSLFN
jgi:hypothetical protein